MTTPCPRCAELVREKIEELKTQCGVALTTAPNDETQRAFDLAYELNELFAPAQPEAKPCEKCDGRGEKYYESGGEDKAYPCPYCAPPEAGKCKQCGGTGIVDAGFTVDYGNGPEGMDKPCPSCQPPDKEAA